MKRLLRGCGVLVVALGVLLAAAYALRSVLFAPWIARTLAAGAAEHAGLGLTVGAVGGSYLTDFTLTDVHTLRPSLGGPVRSVEVRELRVSYRLLNLLARGDPFLSSVEVEVVGARAEVELGAETAAGTEDSPAPGPVALPGVLPRVRVRDTTLVLLGPDYQVELAGVALDLEPRGGAPTPIRASVARLTWDHPALRPGAVSLVAELEYAPDRVLLRRLAVDGNPVTAGVQVGLGELPGAVTASGELTVFGGAARFRARVEGTRLDARLTVDGVEPERAAALLRHPPSSLGGRLFADASVQGDWERPELLTAALTAHLEGGRFRGVPVERLALEAGAADGRARVASLRARVGGNEAELSGVDVPLAPVLAGAWQTLLATAQADLRAELRDLPALLSLGGVKVPAAPLPSHQVTLSAGLRDGRLEVGELHASTPANTVELRDASAPLQALARGEVDALVRAVRGTFRADLRDLPALAALAGIAPALGGRPVPAHHLLLSGTAGDGVVEFAGGRLTAAGAEIVLDKARLDLSAAPVGWPDAGLAAELSAQVPDLGALASLFGAPAAAGALQGRCSLAGTVGAPRGSLQFTGQDLSWGGLALGTATVEAAADGRRLEVRSFSLERGAGRATGRGVFYPEQGRLEGVLLEVSAEDLGYYTRSLAPALDLTGGRVSARLEAAGPWRAPTGRLSLQAGAATLAGVAVEQVELQARAEGGQLHLDPLAVRTGEGELTLVGTVTLPAADGSFAVVLEALRLARGEVNLALQTPAHIAVRTTGSVAVDSLALTGAAGSLTLGGSFDPEGEADLSLEVSGLTGRGWLETLVGSRASFRGAGLRARLTGPVAHPVLTAAGEVAELNLEGAPFPLRGILDLGYGPGGVSLRRLELRGDLGTGVSATGEIPYDPLAEVPLLTGPLALHVVADVPSLGPLIALFAPEVRVDGFLKGSADLRGTWEEPRGRIRFEGLELTLPPSWQPQPAPPLAVECAVAVEGDRVELETLEVRAAELEASATGTWTGAPALARLLRGELGALGGSLALQGRVDIPDLGWLVRDVESVRRLGGSARGELSVEGPVADPVVTAALELADGELLVNGPVPGLRALSGRIVADRTSVRVERLGGELGGAPFRVTGQVVRSVAGEIRADLALQGEDLLLFRNDGVKLRADTDLRVAGPLAALEISGKLDITDGRFVKNVDFLSLLQGTSPPKAQGGLQFFSFPDPPLKDARIDLAITAKAPFQLKNNLVKGGVRPDLRVTGTGEIPVVQGKVYVETTRLRLPAGRLVVESGLVQFLASDPDRPRIDLLAGAKMIGYDITLHVEGPYDEPVVTLSSNPPLPDEELLLLVFAGVPPRSLAAQDAARQSGMMMATYLGRTLLGQALGEEPTESGESILDRFDLVIGQGVTQKGEETIEATFRLKENLLGEHDTLYLRSEKDIYDAYNGGVRLVFRFQ